MAPLRPLPLLSLSTVEPAGSSMLQNATVRVAVACAGEAPSATPVATNRAATPSRAAVRRHRPCLTDRIRSPPSSTVHHPVTLQASGSITRWADPYQVLRAAGRPM